MRRVIIDSVVYFSNEHPDHPASNLLDPGVGRNKWLCTPGQPFCSVVLQLERAVQIAAVYIGTNQARVIEVQVGRSETPTVPCEVLLPRVEFVSYTASRGLADGVQQASFSTGQLKYDTRDKLWDRVRVVCSQPFDPSYKYGLSFIEIFENEDLDNPDLIGAPSRMMALVDGSSSDEEDVRLQDKLSAKVQERIRDYGAWRRYTGVQRPPPAVVRNTRRVKKVAKKRTKKVAKKRTKMTLRRRNQTNPTKKTNGQKETPMQTADDEQPHSKSQLPKKDKQEPSTSKGFSYNEEETTLNNSGSQNMKPLSDEHQRGKAVRASQRRLLGAVVFALSGYSPARRARLRAAAEAMGASFQEDWSPRCTHLICASTNAPELRAVRASQAACIAVHGEWVELCAARRRRLPWQWFATERAHKLPRPQLDLGERRDASG